MTRLPGDRAAPEPCPCCYDGAARVSTGLVLGQRCIVCGGSGRKPPPISDIVEVTITIGGPGNREGEREIYDAVMREISGDHIAVNPDGSITPFRGRGTLLN